MRTVRKPIDMATAWWLPKLPKTAADFVGRVNEIDAGDDEHVWQLW